MAGSAPRIKLTLSPQAEKYVRRDAPLEARRMAARGALPLQPVELATVLFALAHDTDDEVKQTARESLEGLPVPLRDQVLSGPAHPALLSYLAKVHREDEKACEALALNPYTDDATVCFLATLPLRTVVDIISNNQERLLRCEELVDALGSNPMTGRAVIDRILSFLGIATPEGEESDEIQEEEAVSEEDAEAALRALLGEENAELARILASESDQEIEDEQLEQSLYQALQSMSVMQKIKLARTGGKEARSLLIRDKNKVVSSSVIASPKITETEIIAYAQNKSTGEEILRQISRNREWTKNYQIKLGLATNPKTPLPTALKFVNYLQDRDLRFLMKSKDVPSPVTVQARRLLQKKGKI